MIDERTARKLALVLDMAQTNADEHQVEMGREMYNECIDAIIETRLYLDRELGKALSPAGQSWVDTMRRYIGHDR